MKVVEVEEKMGQEKKRIGRGKKKDGRKSGGLRFVGMGGSLWP